MADAAGALADIQVAPGATTPNFVNVVASGSTAVAVTVATSPTVVVVTNTDATAMTSSDPVECVVTDAGHKVTCTAPGANPYASYRLMGADGNDILTVTGPLPGNLTGRGGGDTMSGGDGFDAMQGGDGSDFMSGNAGDDQLTADQGTVPSPNELADGGPGNDILVANTGNGGGDRYVGGPGTDRLIALAGPDGTSPLSVDLAAGVLSAATPAPESHSVSGVEDVITSQGGDTVTGDSGSNVIDTSLNFLVSLGGGSAPPADQGDTVNPGAGVDSVYTGDGNDTINSNDGFGDSIRCGPGTDTVVADPLDTLLDCESVTVVQGPGPDVQAPRCTLSGVQPTVTTKSFFGGFNLKVACDESARLLVQVVARVKRAGQVTTSAVGELVLAEATRAAGTGARTLRLKGSKRFKRSLGKRFTVRLRVESTDAAGNRSVTTKKLVVKPPKPKRRR
jgi:Ca2+-binding RTX toxin-like protein